MWPNRALWNTAVAAFLAGGVATLLAGGVAQATSSAQGTVVRPDRETDAATPAGGERARARDAATPAGGERPRAGDAAAPAGGERARTGDAAVPAGGERAQAGNAQARADTPGPEASLTARSQVPSDERSWGELEGDAGGGFLGPDGLTTFRAAYDLQEGGFTLGLEARLRVRVLDGGVERQGLGVRSEDWDEPSDLAYVLRYATYRRQVRGVSLGFSLGELGGYRMGHATLVRDYASALDIDHPHSGFRLRVAGARFGVDGLLDDFVAPSFAALRVHGVPFRRGIHALHVGATGLLDFAAPLDVRLADDGSRQVDRHRNLATRNGMLGGAGLDVAYQLGDPQGDHLLAYIDGNLLTTNLSSDRVGLGVHMGARFDVGLVRDHLRLRGGLEYARLGPGYVPGWVDLLYDVQRLQLPLTRRAFTALGGAAPTKAAGLLVDGLAPAGNAWRAEASLRIAPWVDVAAHFQSRPGLLGDSVGARLQVVVGSRFLAAALVERFGVLDQKDLGRPDGLLVAAEARYRPHRNVYVLAQYSRLLALGPAGIFRPIDQLNLSVGGAWGY